MRTKDKAFLALLEAHFAIKVEMQRIAANKLKCDISTPISIILNSGKCSAEITKQ